VLTNRLVGILALIKIGVLRSQAVQVVKQTFAGLLQQFRLFYDPVEAAALKAVSVEFPAGRLQASASRIFGRSGHSRFHFTRAEYRPVGMLSMGDFGFFVPAGTGF
jgi:hypothetical protein